MGLVRRVPRGVRRRGGRGVEDARAKELLNVSSELGFGPAEDELAALGWAHSEVPAAADRV